MFFPTCVYRLEMEIGEGIPFIIAIKFIKYLGIILNKNNDIKKKRKYLNLQKIPEQFKR